MTRPLIGLPGRRKKGSQIEGFPGPMGDHDIDVYISDYARSVLAAGGLPVHLPFETEPADFADHLDGLVLTGGADIDPGLYGEQPETDDFPHETIRDEFEYGLLDVAEQAQLPVLGICRGIQLLNVRAGGSLNQHVPAHAGFDLHPTTELHDVTIEPDSRLATFYGASRAVNSLHHQTVDRVGAGYSIAARADDGAVEAIEHDKLPIIAVQWHPEMMTGAATDPIFRWIVEAAQKRRSAPGETP